MQRAKAYGIDAFALNIGTDSFTDTQLGYAYQSAANNGMKVFISFDFAYWSTGNPTAVGQKIAQYASQPAQLVVDGAVFVSSFVGDAVNVQSIRNAAGVTIKFVPNFSPALGTNFAPLDGAFNWMGWPNNGNNRAPAPGQTGTVEAGDQMYLNALNGKDYMAPASPWFFTHFSPSTYNKNWLFPSDTLWYTRWTELLTTTSRYIEIISWNDYGESHYVGPLSSLHYDDGSSKWANDMPHDPWLDMAKPYIAAYKAGATSVNNYITADQIFYWYRPQLSTANCASTDNCGSPPDGYSTVSDNVMVVALLKSAGQLRVQSGGSSSTYNVNAGPNLITFPLGVGQQRFTLTRNSQTVLDGISLKNVINGCVCGLYNFNAYVGMLPYSGLPPSLDANGLALFSQGLVVTTCKATPSLTLGSSTATSTSASATTTGTIMTMNRNPPTTTSSSSATIMTMTRGTAAPTTSSQSASASQVCVSGSGPGNYGGLCSFCCNYGYCPSGPCTCNAYGSQKAAPPTTPVNGQPANGLDSSYSGLCSYACSHGYCPSSACRTS